MHYYIEITLYKLDYVIECIMINTIIKEPSIRKMENVNKHLNEN